MIPQGFLEMMGDEGILKFLRSDIPECRQVFSVEFRASNAFAYDLKEQGWVR
jgi:hypothetical protein